MPTQTDQHVGSSKAFPPNVNTPDARVEGQPSPELRGTTQGQDSDGAATDVRWQFPKTARAAHAFPANDSQSLCGGWIFMGERKPLPGQRRCAACVKAVSK